MPVELLGNTPTPGQASPLTTLAGNGGQISAGATSFNTAAPAPAALQGGQFRGLMAAEWVLVTSGQDGTNWTVTRGVEGSTAVVHADGTAIYHVWTAAALLAAIAANTKAVAIYTGGAYPARPSGFLSVEWIGPVDPAGSATDGDTWINTA